MGAEEVVGHAVRTTLAIMACAASSPGARMENAARRRAAGPVPMTVTPVAGMAFVNLSMAKPAGPA